MGRPAAVVSMARPNASQAVSYTTEELARYEAIVQRYARHVYNVAYRMAGNEADARDLAQETFLRVYRALRRVEPDAPLESWLYRIVSNLYIDLLRKRPRGRVESLDAPVDTPRGELLREMPDPGSSPEAIIEREQLDATIQRALGTLSPDLRMVVVLSDVEGYSYEEIAMFLRVPLGTVKSRLHRARQILQQRLGRYVEARRRGWEPLGSIIIGRANCCPRIWTASSGRPRPRRCRRTCSTVRPAAPPTRACARPRSSWGNCRWRSRRRGFGPPFARRGSRVAPERRGSAVSLGGGWRGRRPPRCSRWRSPRPRSSRGRSTACTRRRSASICTCGSTRRPWAPSRSRTGPIWD